jgi:arylsulfatase B
MQIFIALALLPATLLAVKPNVVFILTDDLGYYAPGYNNPDLITPTLDNLASTGVTLTHHYTYMFCAPSRGAFLTGRFPYKLSATRCNFIPPTIQDGIDLNFTMLPKKLQEGGYISHHVGKWHQGLFSQEYTPQARGFATTDGFLEGGEDHFTQSTFYSSICAAKDIWVNGSVAPQYQGIYTGFRITGTAVNILQNHAARYGPASDTPLFMYLALHNTHAPLEAPQKYLDMYPNVSYLPKKTFYAMTAVVDEAVANVTRALHETEMWNNTLLVWTTDNGSPVTVGGSNYPLRSVLLHYMCASVSLVA